MNVGQKKNIIIVGGGYLGTMAALYISMNPKVNVAVVEKEDRLCGLYRSALSYQDYHFDYGSRVILETGIPELDKLVSEILPDEEYTKSTATLKEFSFQQGQICDYSNCLDARLLPSHIFETGLNEMLAIKKPGTKLNNLRQYSESFYGRIFTESLIEPVILKLTGLPLNRLSPDTLSLYGINRLIVSNRHASRALKAKNSFNDLRIAYAQCDDHDSSILKIYPRRKGLTDYSDRLTNYLRQKPNVKIFNNSSVSSFKMRENKIETVVLKTGEKYVSDHVFWSVPPIHLAKLLNVDTSDINRPQYRNMILSHYLFKGSVNTTGYYHYNYDPNYQYYRATFYENFCERPDRWRSATVESLSDDAEPRLNSLEARFFDELKSTGLISEDSTIQLAKTTLHHGAWPSFSTEFEQNVQKLNDRIRQTVENISLVGKSSGKHHSLSILDQFMSELNEIL